MNVRDIIFRMHQRMIRADREAMAYIRLHANLLRSVLMLGLCVWGVWQNHGSVIAGIVITGALSYFVGFIFALIVGMAWSVITALTEPTLGGTIAALMINVVGFSCVAWLAYQHKETAERGQSKETMSDNPHHNHADQVVPWAVANDVRTSLAAIRFLLFPIHQEKELNELEIASRELSRLEQVFKDIEEKKQ